MSDMMEPGREITAKTPPSSPSAEFVPSAELLEANRKLHEMRRNLGLEDENGQPIQRLAPVASVTPPQRKYQWTQPDLSRFTCKECRDSGWVRGDGFEQLACLSCEEGKKFAAREEARHAREKEELERFDAQWMKEQLLELWSQLDPQYKSWTLESYPKQGNQNALRLVLKYVESSTYEQKGLGLMGPVGSGKTSLMISAFKLVAPKLLNVGHVGAHQLLFVSVPQLLDDLRATYDEDRRTGEPRFDRLFNKYASARLLVLDDIGAERPTEWTQEKLTRLVDARARAELPTWFTTNCSLDELERNISPRCYSRLIYRAQVFEVTGKDLRRECR